jgi:SPP1 gp7 family putative phage head morphogenesis protein
MFIYFKDVNGFIMHNITHEIYRKAFVAYSRQGTPIEWSLKRETSTATHYIWRTRGDDRVRPAHRANNGKVFAWENPPDTGHPAAEYGCRCYAEPIIEISDSVERNQFYDAIHVLEAELLLAAKEMTGNASIRAAYTTEISKLALELEADVYAGKLSWAEAAKKASTIRNDVMHLMRAQSSSLGKALAKSIKSEGRTLNQLIAKYAVQEYGENVDFAKLSPNQQNQVYALVVKAAGRSNPEVSQTMQRLGKLGRGLGALSLSISVYNIATAEDPISQTVEEGAVLGGGFLGGAAGGAAAGLICGPGAPVCVGIGAFVGGALGALGVSWWFD